MSCKSSHFRGGSVFYLNSTPPCIAYWIVCGLQNVFLYTLALMIYVYVHTYPLLAVAHLVHVLEKGKAWRSWYETCWDQERRVWIWARHSEGCCQSSYWKGKCRKSIQVSRRQAASKGRVKLQTLPLCMLYFTFKQCACFIWDKFIVLHTAASCCYWCFTLCWCVTRYCCKITETDQLVKEVYNWMT